MLLLSQKKSDVGGANLTGKKHLEIIDVSRLSPERIAPFSQHRTTDRLDG
jgi:hypothetical protein